MRGAEQPARQRARRRPAQSARAAFSAMSPPAGQTTTGAAARQRAHERAVAAVRHDDVGRRHRARVGQPRHEHARCRGRRPAVGLAAVVGGDHAHRRAAPARRAPRAAGACSGSCAVEGATSTTGPSPGGGVDVLAGRLPQQRPDDAQPRLPAARVLELRQRADQRQRAREPVVEAAAAAAARAARGSRCTRAGRARGPARRRGRSAARPARRRACAAAARRASTAGSRAPTTGARAARASRPARRTARAASAGAAVRMSETATSGANASTDGTVSRAAWTAAS